MAQTITGERGVLDAANARLPRGYRMRAFEDADREPLVEAGNSENHPMERESPAEWRPSGAVFHEPTRLRLVPVAPADHRAGRGHHPTGLLPRPARSRQPGIGG